MTPKDVMQSNLDADVIIENESLPAMGEDFNPDIMAESQGVASGNLMSEAAPIGEEELSEYPDMEPLRDSDFPSADQFTSGQNAASFAVEHYGDGYLRLLVSVQDGNMEVKDASVVGGPLVEQSDLTGEMAYQVLLGERRIASEAFTDLSVRSSCIPPEDQTQGHCIGENEQFDFVVRIPRGEITLDQLSELEIELVRPEETTKLSKEAPPLPGTSFAAAAMDSGLLPPPVVARLSGVKLDELPSQAADAIRRGLR